MQLGLSRSTPSGVGGGFAQVRWQKYEKHHEKHKFRTKFFCGGLKQPFFTGFAVEGSGLGRAERLVGGWAALWEGGPRDKIPRNGGLRVLLYIGGALKSGGFPARRVFSRPYRKVGCGSVVQNEKLSAFLLHYARLALSLHGIVVCNPIKRRACPMLWQPTETPADQLSACDVHTLTITEYNTF